MESEKLHIRRVMLWEFKQGNNTKATAEKICSVYGEGLISDRAVRNWFAKFQSGDTTLKGERPSDSDDNILKTKSTSINKRYSRKVEYITINCLSPPEEIRESQAKQVSQAVEHFFQSKPTTFYKEGIDKLPGRWEKVIHNSGEYIQKMNGTIHGKQAPNYTKVFKTFTSKYQTLPTGKKE
ncbi:hypothetical protein E2986_10916 [Frieseomelitta varia]|uniref:Mos1 transposase HTH domain-containing protein n=1 Tax=Frieseomelitta varia TaxID=561572 RepID=A0A833S4Y7_9HYME|nr:hypothetical protein E2986_10916 [Frieseomelitta varia]